MTTIAIIGSGIGSLALAPLLAKQGHAVTVYEKNSWLGGRAKVHERDSFTFDMGPSWLMMPEVFREWYAMFGIDFDTELQLTHLNPSYKIFWPDYELEVPNSFEKLCQIVEALESDGANKLKSYYEYTKLIYESSLPLLNTPSLSWKSYLKLSTVLPFLTTKISILSSLQSQIYARFSSTKVRQMLLYHLAFLGTAPEKTSSVFASLNYIDMKWGVYYPAGGMGKLVSSLHAVGLSQGVTYHVNTPVIQLTTHQNKITGVQTKEGIQSYDIVVSNVHRYVSDTKFLNRKSKLTTLAPSAVLITAGYLGQLPELAHHSLFFAKDFDQYYKDIFGTNTVPAHPNFYLGVASRTDPTVAPRSSEALSWVIPVSTYTAIKDTNLQDYARRIIKLTGEYLGKDLTSKLSFVDTFAHEYFTDSYNAPLGTALGIPNLMKYSGPMRAPQQDKHYANLYYVGADTTPGIGMPMCLLSALNLAKVL